MNARNARNARDIREQRPACRSAHAGYRYAAATGEAGYTRASNSGSPSASGISGMDRCMDRTPNRASPSGAAGMSRRRSSRLPLRPIPVVVSAPRSQRRARWRGPAKVFASGAPTRAQRHQNFRWHLSGPHQRRKPQRTSVVGLTPAIRASTRPFAGAAGTGGTARNPRASTMKVVNAIGRAAILLSIGSPRIEGCRGILANRCGCPPSCSTARQ
jgi:hypothetical protein